jgi:hypothetical protein
VDSIKEFSVSVSVEEEQVSRLFSLLQKGFAVETEVGISISEFLTGFIGLEREYIAQRIKTIFLDSKPVDDIATAIIKDGSVLALSGAMPGLVGAVMRTGSTYSAFRSTITYREKDSAYVKKSGLVRIKLFNVVLKDLGHIFLERGIYCPLSDLADFFQGEKDSVLPEFRGIVLNQKRVNRDLLLGALHGNTGCGELTVMILEKKP